MHSFSFEAIGTSWSIDIDSNISSKTLTSLRQKIDNRIEKFDITYSRFRADSWVSTLSKETGQFSLPHDAYPLISLYKRLYELSGGLFTPLIGGVLEDAGYDTSYSLSQKKKLVKPLPFDKAVTLSKHTITIHEPSILDFGAGGKGYLVDIISKLLMEENIASFSIDAGGDILHKSTNGKAIRVGLENPENPSQVIGVVELLNKSICGSAGNRRKWNNFHHIINPTTLASPHDIIAVWVVADTTLLADALSTYLFLSFDTIKLKEFNFEYLILFRDFTIERSDGFAAELF